MTGIPFQKMQGAGNDFVILDARSGKLARKAFTAGVAKAIADRRTGVGCDQVILIERARDEGAAAMRIRNADGGEVATCGNAARCVGLLLMNERGEDRVRLETAGGLVEAVREGRDRVSVDMGAAKTDWQAIPLKEAADTLHLDLGEAALGEAVAVSMGNPHAVFFVEDAAKVALADAGPRLEHHPLFPERANIGIAQMIASDRLRLRVWERGAGLTHACGSGACAAVVAAHRRGLVENEAEVVQDGGSLRVRLREDGHVLLSGPAAWSFTGELPAELIDQERAA
ncbi:MAG: diaminopimelate epimerase [Alphaproteobacteria bacterium]|nr:diaminopimelate epimerase [Alphaproteobacteria bacterium]